MRSAMKVLVVSAALVAIGSCESSDISAATEGTTVEVLDGIGVTYLATPGLFDDLRIKPSSDSFTVASNGNVVLSSVDGPVELEVSGGEVAAGWFENAARLDAIAMDSGSVVLAIQDRFFGQLGPDGFQKALPLPDGRHWLASSSRAGTVYLIREGDNGSRIYVVRADGMLSTLAEFPESVRSVADDAEATFVATQQGVFSITSDGVSLLVASSEDLPPPTALAVAPDRLFLASNNRVYVLANGMLLALVRGIEPQLILHGKQLYCWDRGRRLLLAIDVGPFLARG